MPKITPLDKQWDELMFLCRKESEFRKDGGHPKVLKLVTRQIDELAARDGVQPADNEDAGIQI